MFDKRIIKVSSDCSSFIDIDGLLNIENKSFSFVLSIEEYITLFKSDPIKGLEPTNLYFLDENSIKYTCFNCIIGFNMFSNIHITCSSIDLILENIFSPVENILVDEIVFQTSFPKSNSLMVFLGGRKERLNRSSLARSSLSLNCSCRKISTLCIGVSPSVNSCP